MYGIFVHVFYFTMHIRVHTFSKISPLQIYIVVMCFALLLLVIVTLEWFYYSAAVPKQNYICACIYSSTAYKYCETFPIQIVLLQVARSIYIVIYIYIVPVCCLFVMVFIVLYEQFGA